LRRAASLQGWNVNVNGELDPTDKELLQDIQLFNRTYAASGWHIRDKVVEENLSHIFLVRSTITSAQFVNVDWKSALLTDTQFTDVEFQQAQFSEATLERVVFTNCKFVVCSFSKSRLTDCRFINCASEELNAREASFEGCTFESFVDGSGVFGSARLRGCRFEKCQLDNASFYSANLTTVAVRQSSLKNVIFADLKGSELLFEDTTVQNCSFEESRYGGLTFQRGESRGVTFKAFNPERLILQNCAYIEALAISESTGTAPTILECNAVSELSIDHSRIRNLAIERSRIEYFEMKETEVSGNSRIANCAIAGLNLEKSTLIGLQIVNCEMAIHLIADGATLDAVILSGITYAPDLKLSARGVKYLHGSTELRGG